MGRSITEQAGSNPGGAGSAVDTSMHAGPKKVGGKNRRQLTGTSALIASVIAVATSLFHLYTAAFGVLPSMYQRSIHWVLMAVLIFIFCPPSKKRLSNRIQPVDLLFIAATVASGVYLLLNFKYIALRAGSPTTLDIAFGAIMIIAVLEAARRVTGWPLAAVAIGALLYAYFGPYLPALFGHRGYSIPRIVSQMYLFTDGIFGVPLGVSATYVFLFVLFGAFLDKSGAGQTFINLAYALTGRSRGGAAKTAVVSSALVGTISGSVTANVVTTGTFTIPLMKRAGYYPWIAGAVEAVASTGGQIMPPIMGSSAFIMAEFLGIPYVDIAKAALLPALLYFGSVFMMVDLEAGRMGLKGIPSAELPSVKKTLRTGILSLIPIVGLIYLLVSGRTPMFSGLIGILLCIVVGFAKREGRMTLRDVVAALDQGARSALTVAAATACAGIVIGVFNLTGLGLAFSSIVMELAGGRLFIALVCTMAASLVLGLGLTTTACYVVLAVLAAPALVRMGVPVLAAHMFVFFFGTISFITPPVALGAYAAASIAESDPFRTGWAAFRLGIAAFIVPFMFVYGPRLLLIGEPLDIVLGMITAAIAAYALAQAVIGWSGRNLPALERVILFGTAIVLMFPTVGTDIAGVALFVAVYVYRWFTRRGASLEQPVSLAR
ncbi:MAG: TRAP transporter permease [Bacillota bacterium]